MNISDKIKYIGVDDTTIDLLKSQYAVQMVFHITHM